MAEVQMNTSAREYETIYVLRPDAGREASEGISTRVQDVISRESGRLTRVENWGYRKLAYPVRKQTRGVYVYVKYLGSGALVSELERNLRLQDSVLKFQTVKVGDGAASDETSAEELKFEHLEAPLEEEPEDTLAQSLGLEEVSRAPQEEASENSNDSGGGNQSEGASSGDAEAETK